MKNVLITGASSGIGKETALHFATNGWHVIATMIDLRSQKEFATFSNISCYALDVTSTTSIETAKNQILADFEVINVVINNAGMGYRSFVELADDAHINEIVNINWIGVVKVCRAFIPVFRAQNQGHFINISSVAGLVNLPLGSFYHATKQAVESFTECMSYELINFNITTCTVQFGNTPSNFQKNIKKSDATSIQQYTDLMHKITTILNKKTSKNKNLTTTIAHKLLAIAENPAANFTRYTIGFDANLMRILRILLGYKLFNYLVKKYLLK